MSLAASRFAIRRMRPPEVASEGLTREQLLEIAAAALGIDENDAEPQGSRDTFNLPTDASLNPFDTKLISELSNWLHEAAADSDVVLLDVSFERALVRFGSIEQLVVSMAENIAEVWPAGTRLVILVERNPEPQQYFASLLELPGFADAVLFVDLAGRILGDASTGWSEASRVSRAASLTVDDRRRLALDRALRRRGVFRVQTSDREEYAAHKYSIESDELSALVAGFLREHHIDVALFDESSSPWLTEALYAMVNLAQNVSCFAFSDVESLTAFDQKSTLMHERALAALADPAKRVCLIVPMVKHGSRIGELVEALRNLGRTDVVLLSIFMSDHPDQEDPRDGEGWAYLREVRTQSLDGPVRYFFRVRLSRLPSTAWQVATATGYAEDLDDRDQKRWRPSPTGLWMMLDEYEAKTNYTGSDHGVLLRIGPDDWDSFWLASSLLRVIEDSVPWNPKDMLAVVPEEETAIDPISRALEKRLGIAVASVPRNVIDGIDTEIPAEVVEKLQQFRDGHVVLVDESAASYGTLRRLEQIVWDVLDRGPDLRAVVLDLPDGSGSQPQDFVSVYGWRPLQRRAS